MRNIYCDGACKGNPGPAGAAALLIAADGRTVEVESLKALGSSTNQIAELNALILALKIATSLATETTIYSDSQYALNGATEWLPNWKTNGWRNAAKKPVVNKDLWLIIDALLNAIPVTPKFQWIRGHDGDTFNELADKAANKAITAAPTTAAAKDPIEPTETGHEHQRFVAPNLNIMGWRAYDPATGDPTHDIVIGKPIFMRMRQTENRIVVDESGTVRDLAEYVERQAKKSIA